MLSFKQNYLGPVDYRVTRFAGNKVNHTNAQFRTQ